MVDAMNQAYDVTETRAWWRVRLLAIVLTVVLALFILLSFTLVLVGPWAAGYVARHTGLGPAFEWTWKIAQWPVAFALTTVGMAIVNYFAPDVEQEWRWVVPGAVLATVLWLATSLGFRAYVTHVTDYNATYGAVGGIIVLMLWFYLSGLSILIGAEMNAELEHASPEGKDPGERVAG
jgi:membrane protein